MRPTAGVIREWQEALSCHAIGANGGHEGATDVDVPETARGEFIRNSKSCVLQFLSPEPSEADILTTHDYVGSADEKLLFEICTPVTNSAWIEQPFTILVTDPDIPRVCDNTTIRNGVNQMSVSTNEKLKTSLTATHDDMRATGKQLGEMCRVRHAPMHREERVPICSGSRSDKGSGLLRRCNPR